MNYSPEDIQDKPKDFVFTDDFGIKSDRITSAYNPSQPRVPKGEPTGGEWNDDPAYGGDGVPWNVSRKLKKQEDERIDREAANATPAKQKKAADPDFEKAREEYEREQMENSMEGFPEIGAEMRGKLPRPEDMDPADPMKTEVQMVWDRFRKETRRRNKNGQKIIAPGGAASYFAPKGSKVKLDALREEMNEQGFEFSTPTDMIHSVYESLEGRKSWGTASRGDYVAAASAADSSEVKDLITRMEEATESGIIEADSIGAMLAAAWVKGAKEELEEVQAGGWITKDGNRIFLENPTSPGIEQGITSAPKYRKASNGASNGAREGTGTGATNEPPTSNNGGKAEKTAKVSSHIKPGKVTLKQKAFTEEALQKIDKVHTDGPMLEQEINFGAASTTNGHYQRAAQRDIDIMLGSEVAIKARSERVQRVKEIAEQYFHNDPEKREQYIKRSLSQIESKGEIRISKNATNPKATLWHEMGHKLDYEGFVEMKPGVRLKPASDQGGELSKVVDVAFKSKAVTEIASGNDPFYKYSYKYRQYQTSRREVFARAYAQYIAVESGDVQTLSEMRSDQAKKLYGPHAQWDDDDFEPIRAEINEVFKKKGWRK